MEKFKKIEFIDIAIIMAVIIAIIVGIFTLKHFRQTAGKQIEATSKIIFQVYVRGATLTGNKNPIVPGEEAFITIRNVPYTELKILDSTIDTKKVVIPDNVSGKDFMVAPDYSQMCMYDILVTFEDEAKITKDGAVVGGNKIKMGLPITLEGKFYKYSGTVSYIEVVGAQQNQEQEQPQENAEENNQPQIQNQDIQAPQQNSEQNTIQQPQLQQQEAVQTRKPEVKVQNKVQPQVKQSVKVKTGAKKSANTKATAKTVKKSVVKKSSAKRK